MTYVSTASDFGAFWKIFQNVKHIIVFWFLDLSQEGNYQIYWILAVTICFKDSVYLNTLMETYNNKISDLWFLLIKYYFAVSSHHMHSILSMSQFHISTVTKYGAQCYSDSSNSELLTNNSASYLQYNPNVIQMYAVNLQVVIHWLALAK